MGEFEVSLEDIFSGGQVEPEVSNCFPQYMLYPSNASLITASVVLAKIEPQEGPNIRGN